jgi:hypothetical protein
MDIKQKYGTTGTAITITLDSLASSATAGRQSTVVDNTSNLFLDAIAQVQVTVPTGGTAANDKAIYVYVFGTADSTNGYYGAERGVAGTQATIGASDAAYSMTDPTVGGSPLILAAVIPVPVTPTGTNAVYQSAPFSVANCFGGILPPKWGLVVRNYCGIALHSSGNAAWYQGLQQQTA